MADQIIDQGPGYTIAISDTAETLVPYGPAQRPTGDVNHGWTDLRDHPEWVDRIPEAAKSKGLAELLRTMADPVSRVMSTACECAAFDQGAEGAGGPAWLVGGFVITVFRDEERNTDPQNFVELARYILGGIEPTSDHHIGFEMIVEPMKSYFGRSDCYDLMIKPFGRGASETDAWTAFDHAASAAAKALTRDRPNTTEFAETP